MVGGGRRRLYKLGVQRLGSGHSFRPSFASGASAMPSFSVRLADAVRSRKSAVCVGLDPRVESLPNGLRSKPNASAQDVAAAYEQFCCGVIDVVATRVGVVKPQAAFFEQLGPHGMVALGHVIQYAISKDLLVILDGKRNDIGTTAEAYAAAYMGRGELSAWGSDSLTVSPYLGDDSLQPFVDACDRSAAGIFVLVKTSNPGGGFLQDQRVGDRSVYEVVADYLTKTNASRLDAFGYGPVGAVVGATYPEQLVQLRQRMPHSWILVPGYGAQGGSAKDVAAAFDAQGLGGIVNNSRNIIFAHSRKEFAERFGHARWQDAVAAATDEMNAAIEEYRKQI